MRKRWLGKRASILFLILGLLLVGIEMGHRTLLTAYAQGKETEEEKPTIRAAISDGILHIQVLEVASGSGIKAVYVNGYEFTELSEGTLQIRLQQFDAGYPCFKIQAADSTGRLSETYQVANPYYSASKEETSSGSNQTSQLPLHAEETKPVSATGQVTEHTGGDHSGQESAKGEKEFYTIHTKSGKTFYLILDRSGAEETVYFLTEISEQDLLHVTTDNSETLPKNSAVIESAIPVTREESQNPDQGVQKEETTKPEESSSEDMQKESSGNLEGEKEKFQEPASEDSESKSIEKRRNQVGIYFLFGVVVLLGIGIGYYLKVIKKNREGFLEEDEEEEDTEEVYEKDEEESTDEDGFLEGLEEETNQESV